jgi:Domain of unknown function (DUF4116)
LFNAYFPEKSKVDNQSYFDAFGQNYVEVHHYLKNNPAGFYTLNRFWWQDKATVLLGVNLNGSFLEMASDELKNDEEVVRAAVNEFGWAIVYANPRFKDIKKNCTTCLEKIPL